MHYVVAAAACRFVEAETGNVSGLRAMELCSEFVPSAIVVLARWKFRWEEVIPVCHKNHIPEVVLGVIGLSRIFPWGAESAVAPDNRAEVAAYDLAGKAIIRCNIVRVTGVHARQILRIGGYRQRNSQTLLLPTAGGFICERNARQELPGTAPDVGRMDAILTTILPETDGLDLP